jgi:hypothetical protein
MGRVIVCFELIIIVLANLDILLNIWILIVDLRKSYRAKKEREAKQKGNNLNRHLDIPNEINFDFDYMTERFKLKTILFPCFLEAIDNGFSLEFIRKETCIQFTLNKNYKK